MTVNIELTTEIIKQSAQLRQAKLTPCPGGTDHAPSTVQMGDHFWIECPQCSRESYAVKTEAEAISAWSMDVGLKGRSNLIANIKAGAVRSSVPVV